MNPHRLVILSGPSGVGKSPLHKALCRIYPDWSARLRKLVLFNCRAPRPGERDGMDYHFRPRAELESLRTNPRYAVLDVRGDLQALDLPGLREALQQTDVLFEGNPFVGRLLQTHSSLGEIPRLSVFLAPVSREEILYLKAPERRVVLPELITDLMRRKLLRRTRKQKGELSLADLENIEKRAASAWTELQTACHFDWVIPNHDGEDSENWDAFYYPLGDAKRTLETFIALLEGRTAPAAEKWEAPLLA